MCRQVNPTTSRSSHCFHANQYCSWFAYISATEPCLLEDVLIHPKHSLANQVHDHYLPRVSTTSPSEHVFGSNAPFQLLPHDATPSEEQDAKARNMLFNIDGLGVAWYTSSNSDFERGNTVSYFPSVSRCQREADHDGSGSKSGRSTERGFATCAVRRLISPLASPEVPADHVIRPHRYKTIQPPMNDMNFRSICANTETRVCFGHIRAASSTAITPVNNHPFVFGRHGESPTST